jgi:hypothetical protein
MILTRVAAWILVLIQLSTLANGRSGVALLIGHVVAVMVGGFETMDANNDIAIPKACPRNISVC